MIIPDDGMCANQLKNNRASARMYAGPVTCCHCLRQNKVDQCILHRHKKYLCAYCKDVPEQCTQCTGTVFNLQSEENEVGPDSRQVLRRGVLLFSANYA